MNPHRLAVIAITGLAAAGAAYFAYRSVPHPVPEFEEYPQFAGLDVSPGLRLGPLHDASCFWDPDGNPRDKGSPNAVVRARCRYPALPGGNLSTVIHRGWSAMSELAPAGSDWFVNPPSAAVL